VIGVPDEKWGEVGKAICVLKKGEKAIEEQIIEYCRRPMAGYKLPKSVEFWDSLPKSAYGKILKKEIKAKFWLGHERMIAGGKLKTT
jgi:long-chain acyl-CoA synthetase